MRTAAITTILMLSVIALPRAARAQFRGDSPRLTPPAPTSAAQLVGIRAVADVASVGPGERFHLAVVFDIAPAWHIYWRDSGETGAPTELEIKAPEGFVVGPVRYPRPVAIQEHDGRVFAYEKRAVLFVPVTAPRTLPASEAEFSIDVFYLVCRKACLLGRGTLGVSVPTRPARRAGTAPEPGPESALLATHRSRLPLPPGRAPEIDARIEGGRLVVTGPARGTTSVDFFPITTPGVLLTSVEHTVADDRFRLEAAIDVRPHNAGGAPLVVRGLVGLGTSPDQPSFLIDLPIPAGTEESP